MNLHAKNLLLVVFFMASYFNVASQLIDHWETIVYNNDEWEYAVGSNAIPLDWIQPGFDASQWETGEGGFGYGDEDDNTILENILSVYIRKDFLVTSKASIARVLLHADYDDGFAAYLNGEEIARKNLGEVGVQSSYNYPADDTVEPKLPYGGIPSTFEIDTAVLSEGTNTLAIQIHNRTGSSSDLSSNFFLSVGVTDQSLTYGDPPSWFSKTVFESTLPIVRIKTQAGEEILDEPRIDAEMGIVYNGEGNTNSIFDPFNNYDGAIAIELRGTSSLAFDKKGYGFETRNEDGSNNNTSLIEMPIENDWILNGPYSDKSLLRNVLTYHLGNLAGRFAPRTRLCELFINDEYLGVYVLTEKIKQDKNRVDIATLTENDNIGDELTGGYIIKIDRNDQNVPGAGWTSTFPDFKFFAYVEPKDDQITSEQSEYIQDYLYNFELAMSGQDYEDVYQQYIDEPSFVDYFLVTEMGKHIDAFKLSFYMYKDKDSKGGKLHFGPLWDFNLGYGNFDFACSPDPQGWSYEFPDCGSWHPFWARKLADIPNIQNLSDCRWNELRAGAFQTDSILKFIDDKVFEIGSAADRNFDRWEILGEYVWPNDYIGESYPDEVAFLKTWLTDRLDWMDENMEGNCEDYIPVENNKTEKDAVQIYPNPANEQCKVFWDRSEATKMELYDIEGRLAGSQLIRPHTIAEIDVNNLRSGMYFLLFKSLKTNRIISTQRLTVIN